MEALTPDLAVRCPYDSCNAAPGERCRTVFQLPARKTHAARIWKSRYEGDEKFRRQVMERYRAFVKSN